MDIPFKALLLSAALCLPAQAEELALVLDRGIHATLELPQGPGPFPAVLMFHGLGSSRDEVGLIFADTARQMSRQGIASLRIDFRGFGKSDGDTGAHTIERQNEDAQIALRALSAQDGIDPARIGAMGFSFGAGAAIELAAARPGAIRSLVVWAPVGDYRADMLDSMGPRVFDLAAQDGIVGVDLGWRTMALKADFFDSLARHDLLAALARYSGPFMTVNGSDDPYRKYTPALMAAAAGVDKRALVIQGGDHVFHVYIPSRSMAGQVIEATVRRFQDTLPAGD